MNKYVFSLKRVSIILPFGIMKVINRILRLHRVWVYGKMYVMYIDTIFFLSWINIDGDT